MGSHKPGGHLSYSLSEIILVYVIDDMMIDTIILVYQEGGISSCLVCLLPHGLDTCSLLVSSSWLLPWDRAALHHGWDQVTAVLGGGTCSAGLHWWLRIHL